MNRSDFLRTALGGSAALAISAAPGAYQGTRRETHYDYEIAAKAEAIFPLLCPVREYDWIETWACDLVYSKSGVAERDCVFVTHFQGEPMIWTCVRYEPPQAIEYVAVAPDVVAMHLAIRLDAAGSGTRLTWQRVFTSLSARGEGRLHDWTTERERRLGEQLRHFVATGQMLKAH